MTHVAGAVLHCHAAGRACRLVVEGRDAECLIVQALLRWVVHVIEGDRVHDFADAQLLDLLVRVELERDTGETILDGVLVVNSVASNHMLTLQNKSIQINILLISLK